MTVEERKAAATLHKRAAGLSEQVRRMYRVKAVHDTMELLSITIRHLKDAGYSIKVARMVPERKVTPSNLHTMSWRLIGGPGIKNTADIDAAIHDLGLSTHSVHSYIKKAVRLGHQDREGNSSPGYITLVAILRDDSIVGAGHAICTTTDMMGAVRSELKSIGTAIALRRAMEDARIIKRS